MATKERLGSPRGPPRNLGRVTGLTTPSATPEGPSAATRSRCAPRFAPRYAATWASCGPRSPPWGRQHRGHPAHPARHQLLTPPTATTLAPASASPTTPPPRSPRSRPGTWPTDLCPGPGPRVGRRSGCIRARLRPVRHHRPGHRRPGGSVRAGRYRHRRGGNPPARRRRSLSPNGSARLAFGPLATVQSLNNLAGSSIAGILWTLISPSAAFTYLPIWMILASVGLLITARH